MTVEVGQKLDKYELLEEVGQGGMAVVYRGLDTSLKREVAVKVLHRHLADNDESRARFEREAHAVAKLRHENILEIFDFSGLASDESYIVTEFIDGQTLKQFISHYRIRFPEVGALITAQVLRALTHAHGAGILHRDVKPENIMIRSDGVVKLTDFGIAQMIDLQRMTVTGQLLGSPAYMSPEHVSGGRLDFRTDVFSVGILLYQLIVGELPFTGKNPHEILKRIAECSYRPAEKANPLVGERLGRIVARAMAREQSDRYADVGEMLRELERFLADSGLDDPRKELERFFASPASYEMALEQRLVDAWTTRGRSLWAEDRNQALDYFNRVLTLQPEHTGIVALLDSASRRRKALRLSALAVGVVSVVGLAAVAKSAAHDGSGDADAGPVSGASGIDGRPNMGPPPDPRRSDAAQSVVASPEADAGPGRVPSLDAGSTQELRRVPDAGAKVRPPEVRAKPDAAVVAPRRTLVLQVYPHSSAELQVAGGEWQRVTGLRTTLELPPGEVKIAVRNDACCESETVRVEAGDPGGTRKVTLGYLPASIIPECDDPSVSVQIDERPARLGRPNTILLGDTTTGSRTVKIAFIKGSGAGLDEKTVKVRYRESKKVACEF